VSQDVAAKGRLSAAGDTRQSPYISRILTQHPPFRQLLSRLPLLAVTDLPVLIMGEPGTGKELVAEALWALSPRAGQPFLRLNCANLGGDLAASELFGHLKGSFTGADRTRAGKFQAAHRGTLFLDEVGELPPAVQPRLLRVLEQGEIEPLGGDRPRRVDVRLLAATNRNLPQLIAQGRFRQDVFDRLAVLVVELPPLRERGEDVLLLARHFLREEARRYRRRVEDFSAAAQRRLQEYPWPGNVRELRNVVTRAVLFSSTPLIQESDLLFAPSWGATWARSGQEGAARPGRQELEELIRQERGNVSAAARRLGVCTRTIYRWLKTAGIDLNRVRSTPEAAAFQAQRH